MHVDGKTHKRRVWVSGARNRGRASERAHAPPGQTLGRPRRPIVVFSSLIAAAAAGGRGWIASVPQEA
eukprot:15466332-Alexandrium_andersonii.AAC.1